MKAADVEPAPVYTPSSSPPEQLPSGPRLAGGADVFIACADIKEEMQEHFVCFDLNVRHRIIARRLIGKGTLTGVEAHPREIFRGAILAGAAAVILAHNHPSGDPTPSRADLEVTQRMRETGELCGIPVLDHVVVSKGGYISLAERNWR
jgi:DNA repair protein RadC